MTGDNYLEDFDDRQPLTLNLHMNEASNLRSIVVLFILTYLEYRDISCHQYLLRE